MGAQENRAIVQRHAFTLRNGKVVAFQDYTDTSVVVAELSAAQARA